MSLHVCKFLGISETLGTGLMSRCSSRLEDRTKTQNKTLQSPHAHRSSSESTKINYNNNLHRPTSLPKIDTHGPNLASTSNYVFRICYDNLNGIKNDQKHKHLKHISNQVEMDFISLT